MFGRRLTGMSRSMSVEPGRRGSIQRQGASGLGDKKNNTPSPTRRRCGTGSAASRLAHENDDSSDDSEMSVSKLETIKTLAVERKQRSEMRTHTKSQSVHRTGDSAVQQNCTTPVHCKCYVEIVL